MPLPDITGRTAAVWPVAGFVAAGTVIGILGWNAGGFLPTTQGWVAVTTWWVVLAVALLHGRTQLSSSDLAFVAGLASLAGFAGLSAIWSRSSPSTLGEEQRYLAYAGLALAGVLLVRRTGARALAAGVHAGLAFVAVYALATRLYPDRIGYFDSSSYGYRLSAPITYWNGLGIASVMALLLSAGAAARGRTLAYRAAAGASMPPIVATVFFTFSRGAWLALAVGLVVAVAADPRRLHFIASCAALALPAAAAVDLARARPGLTVTGSSLARAASDGHSLSIRLLGLAGISAVLVAAITVLERRLSVPASVRTALGVLAVTAFVAGGAAVWAVFGSPNHLATRFWNGFRAAPTPGQTNLTSRLFQTSSNGRIDLWRVAWHEFERHPLGGTGGGSFWQEWVERRPAAISSQEGHSLYLETLGELGASGFALLVIALGAPLAAGVRARRHSYVPPLLAAYSAFLAHAAVDWDWELAAVGGAAVLLGVAITGANAPSRWALRPAVVLAPAILALAWAVPTLVADSSLAAGRSDLPGDPGGAIAKSKVAQRWAPWSAAPYELAGDAYRAAGRKRDAAHEYNRALAKDPKNWDLWARLSDVQAGGAAAGSLRRAHALNPAVDVASVRKPHAKR